jgi:hypothetical protein
LKEILHYDALTGDFTWKVRLANCVRIGDTAGSITGTPSYIYITINKKAYPAHKLAWLYVTGVWPIRVDHKNTVRTDNRWCNLREATAMENNRNRSIGVNNNSGIKGVCWNKLERRWEACVMKGTIRHHKKFTSLEEASVWVRLQREQLHGEFANHG